ncbi:MAG: hypothetical protein WD598_17035 [Acidimicrobiia bacterium]
MPRRLRLSGSRNRGAARYAPRGLGKAVGGIGSGLATMAARLAQPAPAPAPTYSGGGGSGGGGGTGGAYDYSTDATYQAYVRALDLDEAQRRAETTQRRAYINADRDRMLGETALAGTQQREDIGGAFEDRGLYLSGGRLRDQARSSANQLMREGRLRSDAAQGLSSLDAELARAIARIQLQRQAAQYGVFQ